MDDVSNIVCGFCNAPWTDEMIAELDSFSEGCDSCGYGTRVCISLKIVCKGCGRVIYRKDGLKVEY